jgi:serine/threonine-protein kinase
VPFLNLSADPENEIFVDGITEDIIAQLSKVRALKVIARTSMMPFKKRDQSLREIGARLGATTLLDGSVRRIGDRVRIVAQLVDAETEQQLWAETYDRQLTDIFAIQTDVALHIAGALEAELSVEEQSRIRKEPTRSIASYQLYQQGRYWFLRFNPNGFQRAIEYFGRATADDPGYALAHVGIAMAYAELVESGALSPAIGRPRAMQAADEALRLDPGLAEAHCAVAHLKSLWEFDWQGAEAGFRRAIALNPNSADAHDLYGRMCAAQQRYDDALALQRRAQELDPLAHRMDVATTLLRAGRYAEAEAEAARAAEFDPEYDRAHATLGWAQLKQGDVAHGLASLGRAVTLSPDDTQWLAQLGQARALAGDAEGARDILRQLEERAKTGYVASYHLAFIYTGLGEHQRALDLLERAYDERAGAVYAIKGSFLFAPLRDEPRFEALLARINQD